MHASAPQVRTQPPNIVNTIYNRIKQEQYISVGGDDDQGEGMNTLTCDRPPKKSKRVVEEWLLVLLLSALLLLLQA